MAQTFHQVWQLENKQEEKRLAVFLTRADSSPNRFSKTTYVVLSFEKKEKLSLFSPHSQLQPFFLAFLVSGILLLMAALCNQSIAITELSSTPRVVPALSLSIPFSLYRLKQAMADPSFLRQSKQMKCSIQVKKLNISIIIYLHMFLFK